VFLVRAMTPVPGVHFDSDPDSGYSVDNLAPAPPGNLHMTSATEVAWDEAPEEDFDYFSLYGSESPEFGPAAVLIEHTIGTTVDVSEDTYTYYHVTATDFAGNEGDASSVENTYASIVAEERPASYALMQNRPNPFDATTFIRFDLPEPGEVSLLVYDVNGKLVRRLTSRSWAAGRHSVTWRGDDDQGNTVGPGIYFLRMETGGFQATRKMMIVK
jgi:hypothetical protein